MEHNLLNIRQRDRIKNEAISRTTNIKDSNECQVGWGYHIIRVDLVKWTNAVTVDRPRTGVRSSGRQRKRWCDDFLKWETCGLDKSQKTKVEQTMNI